MPGSSMRSGLANCARISTLREFGADARVDRGDAPGKFAGPAARRRVIDACCPTASLLRSPLRGGKIDIDRIEPLQRRQIRANGDILAEVDIAQAEPAGEGRADRLLRNDGARVRDGRRAAESRVAIAVSTVDCGVLPLATSCFWRSSVASAFLSCARPLERSACSTESSMVTSGAPASTSSSRTRNGWTVTTPAACGAIVMPWKARKRSDRGQLGRPFLDARLFDRDRGRLGREHRAEEAADHGRLDHELEIGEPGRQPGEENQHQEEHDRPAYAARQQAHDQKQRENRRRPRRRRAAAPKAESGRTARRPPSPGPPPPAATECR